MAQFISITASPRTTGGKGAARQARLKKKVPAVVYGHDRASQSLEVDAQALEQVLSGVEPSSTLVELTVEGKKARALIREIQRHPVRPDIIHIDFYEIKGDEKVRLKVPVHLTGTPDGVRNAGGVLDQVTREVEIAVLPEHIPDRVELDVTTLTIGHSVHVADLTIATVVPPRAEEVVAPAAETGTEVAEPELIRKVREGEEGEEGEAEAEGKAPEAAPAKPEKSKGGKEG